MEENKNINTDFENNEEQKVSAKKKFLNLKKLYFKRSKKLKNQALLKKGSYSVAITAIVIAGVIIFNVLVGALSERFVLEYDFSAEKQNSVSEENKDYIKGIKDDVSIIFCADEENYPSYMSYYAQQYGVTEDASKYYEQTLKLVNKYSAYNKKISVKFIDTQSSEFTEVTSQYSTDNLTYGDIIVSSEKSGTERYKKIGYTDIYSLEEDQTYASMGYVTSMVNGNNIENVLTSAIAYVTSDKIKKVAFLTGHTSKDGTASYKKMLESNNYEIDVISDSIINSIPDKYDAVVIPAPDSDFLGSEINAIQEFLDNDSKLNKGLIVFTDVTAPYLTNLYDFLSEWDIEVEDGILFETNSSNYIPDDPTTLGSYNTEKDDITSGMNICITGYNVPITSSGNDKSEYTVTELMTTPESTIAAPKGSGADFTNADNYEGRSYATAVQSSKNAYDSDNKKTASYITVFSSVDFLDSQYNESSSVANKDLTFAATERVCGAEKSDISFVTKSISNESFSDSVTQSSVVAIRLVFMIILPLTVLIAGIYIFVKRRNA